VTRPGPACKSERSLSIRANGSACMGLRRHRRSDPKTAPPFAKVRGRLQHQHVSPQACMVGMSKYSLGWHYVVGLRLACSCWQRAATCMRIIMMTARATVQDSKAWLTVRGHMHALPSASMQCPSPVQGSRAHQALCNRCHATNPIFKT
jgi:hypothetical protein